MANINMTKQTKPNTTPEFLIFIVKEELSDKSEVFNVIFGDFRFAATTERDAVDLAEKISEAINDHSCNTADVISEI